MKTRNSKLPKLMGRHGFIMLALLLILVITGSTFVLAGLNNRQSAYQKQQTELHIQMEAAKAALLSYAANSAKLYANARGPGFFPCPDTNNDGQPETLCNSDFALIGRLPQYQNFSGSYFRFNDAYAGVDQQFWYVVGPRYVYHTLTSSNRRSYKRTYADSSSPAASAYWLKLDSQSTAYVAFIIAPGEELSTQNRSAGPTTTSNYLDGLNGSDSFTFHTSYSSNPELFNDQILGITLDEYMVAVGTAVATEIKAGLDQYRVTYGIYPPSSGSMNNTNLTSCSTSGLTYSNAFDTNTHTWLRDNTAGNNGERWSCAYGTYWVRDTTNTSSGALKFNGCNNIAFTLTYTASGGNVTRSGRSCQTLIL